MYAFAYLRLSFSLSPPSCFAVSLVFPRLSLARPPPRSRAPSSALYPLFLISPLVSPLLLPPDGGRERENEMRTGTSSWNGEERACSRGAKSTRRRRRRRTRRRDRRGGSERRGNPGKSEPEVRECRAAWELDFMYVGESTCAFLLIESLQSSRSQPGKLSEGHAF